MAQRGRAATGETMSQTVDAMLAGLGPLDAKRAVLAALARQLAATLDGMDDPSMRSRMTGQTAGALIKILDRLGFRGRHRLFDTAPTAAKSANEEVWYKGIEGDLYAEELAWRIQRHARRHGLRVPGTTAYSANPWAVDPSEAHGRRMRIRGRRAWFVGDVPNRQPLRLG